MLQTVVSVPSPAPRTARGVAAVLAIPGLVAALIVASGSPELVRQGEAEAAARSGAPAASTLVSQTRAACPHGICPGLGNSFYLPDINGFSVNTGGIGFFKDTNLGSCATIRPDPRRTKDFQSSDSMERFTTSTMSDFGMDASYSTRSLTVRGTTQAMTSSRSDIRSSFTSTHMDITTTTQTVDFNRTDHTKCYSASNLSPGYVEKLSALPSIAPAEAAAASAWQPYVAFLQGNGSHVMMQQQLGSRFQRWESSTSSARETLKTLKIKACAEVEGANPVGGGGWSVTSCGSYSSEERKEALRTDTKEKQLILGGTEATRTALHDKVTPQSLSAFIASSAQGDQSIHFRFTPVWEVLINVYSPLCNADVKGGRGKGTANCQNLQRAVNLQAAYEGWLAVGCTPESDDRGPWALYQAMKVAGTTSLGTNIYQCWLDKTGCRSNNDCRIGRGEAQCYCYGKSCIDAGALVPPGNVRRNTVRRNLQGGYRQGVNNSCRLTAYCSCNTTWPGGEPVRYLYKQTAPSS
jgi:hypothetical protein